MRTCCIGSLIATAIALSTAYPLDASVPVTTRRGPTYLHVEPGSGKLIVLCEKSGTVARVDPKTGKIESEVHLGGAPSFLTPHPDGARLYITCTKGQEIIEMDARSLETLRRFPLRGEPTGNAVSADGKRLYAGVHLLDQGAVFDLESGLERKRLAAGNAPYSLRLAAEQGRVYAVNLLTNPMPPDQSCRLEITVLDDRTARVVDRIELINANVGREIELETGVQSAPAPVGQALPAPARRPASRSIRRRW